MAERSDHPDPAEPFTAGKRLIADIASAFASGRHAEVPDYAGELCGNYRLLERIGRGGRVMCIAASVPMAPFMPGWRSNCCARA